MYKIQIGGDIYSILEELYTIIHRDIEKQAHHIQVLLADKKKEELKQLMNMSKCYKKYIKE